ncbi:MAG: hypothetical protein FWG50_10805 [Kiritimatiellaeota bacterium]|nr:hypothetical protein [Kiritimatiellota bacterium]
MKTKALFFISLGLLMTFAAAEEKTVRNYTMVDRQNGLTSTLLSIGTTSLTFSVEWSRDMDMPDRWFYLMGKFDLAEAWNTLVIMGVDPTKGKTIFEIPYDDFTWCRDEDSKAKLEKQAFFSVEIPDPNDTNGWIIEEVRKEMEAEKNAEKAAREEGQAHVETTAGQTPDMNGGQSGEVPPEPPHPDKTEGERPREPNAPVGHAWLYLAILPLVLAALWLLRRRKG